MKKLAGIALVLALALSTAVMAEGTTEPVPATDPVPAVTQDAAAEQDSSAALQDAMDAYRAAKQEKAVDSLEEELNGYVAAGTMTQEQADLILNNMKERTALKNGQCPNCGYQFSNGGKGQRGMGGKGGRQQRGGMQRGQMPGNPMNGQQMPQNPQM